MTSSKKRARSGSSPGSSGPKEPGRILDELLGTESFPGIAKLLATSDAEGALRAELEELVRRFVGDRAPRQAVKVLAKIVRETDAGLLEQPVIVRDISETGAQLAISARAGVTFDLGALLLRLRVDGLTGDILVRAQLVRVLRADRNFVHVGVRFLDLPAFARPALHKLTHATSMLPTRRSVGPESEP